MSAWPEVVHVVVPCRDEAAHLERHLAALTAAVDRCAAELPEVCVSVTVVLDGCRDASAEVVGRHRPDRPWLHALEVRRGRVGAVRADGVAHARLLTDAAPDRTWLAHTDADSEVPAHWLVHQADVARQGLDLWLGTVRPATSAAGVLAWAAAHRVGGHALAGDVLGGDLLGDQHAGAGLRHVHGANLGVRLSAYDAAGGFPDLATGEDVALAAALVRRSAPLGADDLAPVLTSARLVGRAPEGFATFLATMDPVGG